MLFKDYLQNMTTLENSRQYNNEYYIQLLDTKFEEHTEMQAKFTDFASSN